MESQEAPPAHEWSLSKSQGVSTCTEWLSTEQMVPTYSVLREPQDFQEHTVRNTAAHDAMCTQLSTFTLPNPNLFKLTRKFSP